VRSGLCSSDRMVNKSSKTLMRLVISLLIVYYLAIKVDWRSVLLALEGTDIFLYVASFLLAFVANLVLAFRYFLLIRNSSIKRSFKSLLKINLVARFYGLLMPLGAEAAKWYKVTRNQNGKALFGGTIVFERLTFFLLLHVVSVIPLLFYSSNSEIVVFRAHIMPTLLLSWIIVCLCLAFFVFPLLRRSLEPAIFRAGPASRFIKSFLAVLESFSSKTVDFHIYFFGLSVMLLASHIGRLYLLFKAASLPVVFMDVAWMGSLVLLLQAIPITFAGIGIREGAYAYLFTLFKLPPEKGVLIGVLSFSHLLLVSLLGGILELSDR